MKTKAVTNVFSVLINAKPEDVFAYVSDLTRHDEWNEGLKIEAVTPGPVNAGSQYHSWGNHGKGLLNEVKITDYQPSTRFAFVSSQVGINNVTHEFSFAPQDGGTLVKRTVTGHMTPLFEFVWRLFIWPFSDRPAMNKCMAALKAQLERFKA
jgi:uncharacterized protein YndB with AHSA1/START domain